MEFHKAVGRVLARLDKSAGCWVWTGAKNRGYGVVRIDGKQQYVHRFLYEQLRESIPAGLQLDHLCRNRACANPAHLEAVTGRVNVLRGETITAANARKTHCQRGHPFSEANLHTNKQGRRVCKPCRLDAKRVAQGYQQGLPPPAQRTHCPRGHPYSGDNLGIVKTGPDAGDRYCRECNRDAPQPINRRGFLSLAWPYCAYLNAQRLRPSRLTGYETRQAWFAPLRRYL